MEQNDSSILMKHNIETFNKAMELLLNHGKVAVVQPTGTGKSYIAMQIMREIGDCKKIVIAPNRDFLSTMEHNKYWDRKNTVTFTYQYLGLHRNEIEKVITENIGQLSDIGLIVLDELHRAGAKYWEEAVNNLISSCKNSKLLGLTATPIRSNDKRDMVNELFDNYSVGNISLCDAITDGILPKIDYVLGVASANRELSKLLREYKRHNYILRKYGSTFNDIKSRWCKENTFKNTLIRYLTPNGLKEGLESKHIVFVQNIKDIAEYKNIILDGFSEAYKGYNINILEAHSKLNKRVNTNSILEFSKPTKKNTVDVMITVQMLNESFHFNEVKSISMFRYTEATNVFIQQVGRGLSANGQSPFIFDFVDNFDAVGDIAFLAGNASSSSEKLGFIFNSFNNETDKCIEEINKFKTTINNRIAFHNYTLPQYARKYSTLYEIPDTSLKDWAIQQYRLLKCSKSPIILNHIDDFKLTEFIDSTAGESWLQSFNKIEHLNNQDRELFISKTLDYDICGSLPDYYKSEIENILHIKFSDYETLDQLKTRIIHSKNCECKRVLKLLDSIENDNDFEIYNNIKNCTNQYDSNGSYTYGIFNIDRACAYRIWSIIKNDSSYEYLRNIKLDSSDEALHSIIKRYKKHKETNTDINVFKLLNTGILSNHFDENKKIVKEMLSHYRINTYKQLVVAIDEISMFSYRIKTLREKCISILENKSTNTQSLKLLIDNTDEFMSICNNDWLCDYFKDKANTFRLEVLPFVAYITQDSKYFNLKDAYNIVTEFMRKEALDRKRTKSLKDTKQARYSAGIALKNISAKHGLDGFDTCDYVENYVNIIKSHLTNDYDNVINNKITISREDIAKFKLIYKLAYFSDIGLTEYDKVNEIFQDTNMVTKLNHLLLGSKLRTRVLNTLDYVNNGFSIEEAAFECDLYNNIPYSDEDTIELILNSKYINHNNTFYDILKYIEKLPYESYSKMKSSRVDTAICTA